jgi:hypothetical protein
MRFCSRLNRGVRRQLDGSTLMTAVRAKRLRFLAIWLGVFGAIYAWWLIEGALTRSLLTEIWMWLNTPSLFAGLIISGNVHQPSFVAWTTTYFAQWLAIGYLIAFVAYRKGKQQTT